MVRKTAFCCVLISLFVLSSVPSRASSVDELTRLVAVDREMDCVEQHAQQLDQMGWSDVCYTKKSAPESGKDKESWAQKYESDPVFVNEGNLAVRDESEIRVAQAASSQYKDFFYRFFDVSDPLNTFEIGPEAYRYIYKERSFMKDKGYLYGLKARYTHRTSENKHLTSWKDAFSADSTVNMFRIEGRGAMGEVDYESEGTGTLDDLDYYTAEVQTVAGYDIPLTKGVTVTPYFGFGFRYLLDDSGGKTTTTGHWSYDRESRYFYLPLGFEMITKLKNRWSVGFWAEYDIFIDGEQTSHLEDGGVGYDPLDNDQDDGFGVRGGFGLTRESERVDLFLETFFRWWNIDASDVNFITQNGELIPVPDNPGYFRAGLEPENQTTEYGVAVGARF